MELVDTSTGISIRAVRGKFERQDVTGRSDWNWNTMGNDSTVAGNVSADGYNITAMTIKALYTGVYSSLVETANGVELSSGDIEVIRLSQPATGVNRHDLTVASKASAAATITSMGRGQQRLVVEQCHLLK